MKQRNKWKRRASVLLMAAMMLNTTFVAQAKWFHDDDSDKWYYENNNGNRIKDDVVQIGEDGKWYAFDQDGWMRTGWIDDLGGVNRFYAFPSQAGNLADDQWALIDGDWYRFKKISKQGDRIEGGLVEGDKVHKIHDKYYYFDRESKMVSDAIIDLGDAVFYANEDGSLSEHEWQHFKIDDSNPNATIKSVTKCDHKVDERCDDCSWYYFRDVMDGNEYEGMLRASNDNNKDPYGIRIRPLGPDEKNRKYYAFDREGKMIFSDWRLVDDAAGEYYFQHSGERAEGKSLPINGYWYTFDNSGKVTEYAEIPNSSGGYVEEEIWSKATRSNAAPARAISSISSPENKEVSVGEKVELKFNVTLASDSNAKRQGLTEDHDVWINSSKNSHPKVEIKDNAYVVSFTAGMEANSEEDFCLWADGLNSGVVTVKTILTKSEEIKQDDAKDIVNNILNDKDGFKGSETAAVNNLKTVYSTEDPLVKETVQTQLLSEVQGSDNNNLKALEDGYKAANKINVADPSVSEEAKEKVGTVTVTGAGLNAKETGDNVQLNVDVSEETPELDKSYDNVVPFEITFTINGDKVNDVLDIPVVISMQLPEGLNKEQATEENTQLFNIHGGDRIKVKIKIRNGMVYFVTDRFSTYVFAQDLTSTPPTPPTPSDTPSGGGGGGRGNNVNSALTTNSGSNSGEWIQDATGWWIRLKDGTYPVNTWMYLDYNGVYKWYRFDAAGYMSTGWYTDADGRKYYLNPVSDGTKGAMLTGWQFIDGFWYYFNPVSDGTQGALLVNTTTPDGYVVNANGQWIQ